MNAPVNSGQAQPRQPWLDQFMNIIRARVQARNLSASPFAPPERLEDAVRRNQDVGARARAEAFVAKTAAGKSPTYFG